VLNGSGAPPSVVAVCTFAPLLIQVTEPPAGMDTAAGLKPVSDIVTVSLAGNAAA
jgi:hypothetical protein